jgi:hypothetical protein
VLLLLYWQPPTREGKDRTDGESPREVLNYKIKAFIRNAFDVPQEK